MKTNKFTSNIDNVFNKNSNSKTVLKNEPNEPRDIVIKYETESQKKEKIINELKSFISNKSSHDKISTVVTILAISELHIKTLSRLVYFYNLTNPDNFERFKKNVDDGYLLLMLLNGVWNMK